MKVLILDLVTAAEAVDDEDEDEFSVSLAGRFLEDVADAAAAAAAAAGFFPG